MRESALLFGRGLLRHFRALVPGGVLAVLGLVERETGKAIAVPEWAFWLVFGVGVLIAALLAFHELRTSTLPDASLDVRRGIGDEIGAIINEGEGLWELGLSADEFSERAADWWNAAGTFIEAVLGQAERHIVSEPQSAPSLPELVERYCNLLRGSLRRLPDADLRVDEPGLEEAITMRLVAVHQS